MYPIKYILNEVLPAEICYLSESTQKERILNVKIRSFSFIQTQQHYVINYIEKTNAIKTLKVNKIEYIKLKDNNIIEGSDIINWLESLKNSSSKEEVIQDKKNTIPINFSSNWIHGKKVVISGDAVNEDYDIVDRKEVIYPLIKELGGDPKSSVSGQTDILITIGDCEDNVKYTQAKNWGIHIIDFEKVKELYKREFNQELKLC